MKTLFLIPVISTVITASYLRGTDNVAPQSVKEDVINDISDIDLTKEVAIFNSINSKLVDCVLDPGIPFCTTDELLKRIHKISTKEQQIMTCIAGHDHFEICDHPRVKHLSEHFRKQGNVDHFLALLAGCNLRESWYSSICKLPHIHHLLQLGKKDGALLI